MNYEETLSKCREFKFDEETTRLTLWNEAYWLGRTRWHWGPSWAVSLRGWLNTQLGRIGIKPIL